MNYGYVRFILGRILLLETALVIPSLLISLIDKEASSLGSFHGSDFDAGDFC